MEEMQIIWDWVSNVLIGSGLLGAGTYLGRLVLNKMIRKYTIKSIWKYIQVYRGKKPQTHKIFDSLEDKLYEIAETKLSTPLKTKLYQIILENKVRVVTAYLEFWSIKEQKYFKEWDGKVLLKSMQKLIPEMIEGSKGDKHGYEFGIYRELLQTFGEDKGRFYFDHVYTKNFKPEHDNNIEYIRDFFDKFFLFEKRDNYYLIDEFMDRINMALIIAISDMKKVISNMNGVLEDA